MRFVTPEVVRIPLKHNEWIEVKKDLTVGEEKRFRTSGFKRVSQVDSSAEKSEAAVDVDWMRLALARVETYLLDWSAKDSKGKDLPVSRAAIENLCTEDFDEIDAAIQAHIETQAELKKTRNGGTPPPATSSS